MPNFKYPKFDYNALVSTHVGWAQKRDSLLEAAFMQGRETLPEEALKPAEKQYISAMITTGQQLNVHVFKARHNNQAVRLAIEYAMLNFAVVESLCVLDVSADKSWDYTRGMLEQRYDQLRKERTFRLHIYASGRATETHCIYVGIDETPKEAVEKYLTKHGRANLHWRLTKDDKHVMSSWDNHAVPASAPAPKEDVQDYLLTIFDGDQRHEYTLHCKPSESLKRAHSIAESRRCKGMGWLLVDLRPDIGIVHAGVLGRFILQVETAPRTYYVSQATLLEGAVEAARRIVKLSGQSPCDWKLYDTLSRKYVWTSTFIPSPKSVPESPVPALRYLHVYGHGQERECFEVAETPANMYQGIRQLLKKVGKMNLPWRLLDSNDKQLIASWTLAEYLEKDRPGVVEEYCK